MHNGRVRHGGMSPTPSPFNFGISTLSKGYNTHLETAAEQLTLRRDVIYVVDAIGKIEGSPIGGQNSEAADANPK